MVPDWLRIRFSLPARLRPNQNKQNKQTPKSEANIHSFVCGFAIRPSRNAITNAPALAPTPHTYYVLFLFLDLDRASIRTKGSEAIRYLKLESRMSPMAVDLTPCFSRLLSSCTLSGLPGPGFSFHFIDYEMMAS